MRNLELHYKALTELVELMSVASLIALIADFGWVMKDINANGLSVGYILIALGLGMAVAIMIPAVYKYHSKQVCRLVKLATLRGNKC